MSCWDTIQAYAFRSISGDFSILGFKVTIPAERLLPSEGYGLCQQFTLIGSGLIWNIYFGVVSLFIGFFIANAVALGKAARHPLPRKLSEWFIFIFRGSPLFIQFFFAYFLFLMVKQAGYMAFLTAAQAGALIVLILNTAAYSGEIFYGALRAVPRGDVEAADSYGFTGWKKFRRIVWPTMLRLGWPAYTNEAIFLFQATTLVFFSAFPTLKQQGDALYYANFFADKTFNPFVPYPILAFYFILLTLCIISVFGLINRRLNRHLPQAVRTKLRPRINLIR